MEKTLQEKINDLSNEQRRIYKEKLIGICEFRDLCISYGAKDSINLPQEDIETIKKRLYEEEFGSGRYKISFD